MIIDRNSPIPQYFQLQTWLIEQIEQGVFKPNDKIPTEEELSQLTGLARATIRQAIQNLANMGYVIRKKRLGTFVLRDQQHIDKKTMVGIIIPDIRTGYAPVLARGAEDEASQSNYSLILCNSDDLFVKADYHADRLIEIGISGVIFVPTAADDEKNLQVISKFQRKNIPVVLADRIISGKNLDYVTTDNFNGAYQLTDYLIHRGHRRIGITLSDRFSTEKDRLAGYKKALLDNAIPIDPKIIQIHSGPYAEKPYMKIARSFLKEKDKITAIFAGHDRIAYVIYTVAEELGLRIPEDLSMVGYDDLRPTCSHMVSLTTMHQPIYEMGQESMRLIMKKLSGEGKKSQQVILNSILKERDSVAEIPITDYQLIDYDAGAS
jgi:DNA-binding LacI/PurR family transcriptional regulator